MPLSHKVSSLGALLSHVRSALIPHVAIWTDIRNVSIPVSGELDTLVVTIPPGCKQPELTEISFEGNAYKLSYRVSESIARPV
jgi:hypothetical protein